MYLTPLQFINISSNTNKLSTVRDFLFSNPPVEKVKSQVFDVARFLRSALYLGVYILSLTPYSVHSQPLIEELQRLNFGILAVPANETVSQYTFPQTGNSVTVDGQFILIATGTTGIYSLSGFPAFTPLSISLNDSTLATSEVGISESLAVDNYDVSQPTTDEQGNAELSLGARLNTTGNGNGYGDAIYEGRAMLRIEYWQPEVNAFVFNSKLIDMEAELRSTVALVEEQRLNFGTLFARTSSTEQAELIIAPSGIYTVTEPGGSRLVVLSNPEQAVIKVDGAAAFNNLAITPQLTEVLLQHVEFPDSAPHFSLTDLVTSPSETGSVDSNGELLISIGGTLKTELTDAPVVYPSGVYEGIYEFTVSY